MKNLLIVIFGSGIGGGFRYATSSLIRQFFPSIFPLGTFLVNILGCLLIGMVLGATLRTTNDTSELKLLLATGFCGGFTTFSAFASENLEMMRNGNHITAIMYIILSVVIGILSTFIGSYIFK